jgi:tetratricopeptide (TPR) repeat protein
MKSTKRALLNAATFVLLVLVAAPLTAQEGEKKSDIPDKPKNLQKEETKEAKKKDDPRSGPSASREDFEAPSRDPAEVKKLQEKIRSINQKQISKLDQILAVKPTHPRKADMLFQKAELMYEVLTYDNLLTKAKWMKCLEGVQDSENPLKDCPEPKADYSTALNVYKQVLQEFPEYGRLDEVIYRLGDGLMKATKKKEAISFLTRLVKNYPKSKYLADSHLAIAEFWFDQNLLTPAKLSYEEVLKFKNSQLRNYALYKLAWVLYNQKEYRDAVNTFKGVIEAVEADPRSRKLAFANQALNDLIVSWVEIEGGWIEAKDYFIKKRDKTYSHKKLCQMASLYDNDGKNEPRIQIFEYLLKDDPLDKKAPDYWEAIIDAKKKLNVRAEWESSVRKMIGYFDMKAKWWGANGSDKRASNNARMMAEGYLAQLATEYHQKAQKDDDPKLYAQAAKDYALFIDKFPESEAAYDTRFYYGYRTNCNGRH